MMHNFDNYTWGFHKDGAKYSLNSERTHFKIVEKIEDISYNLLKVRMTELARVIHYIKPLNDIWVAKESIQGTYHIKDMSDAFLSIAKMACLGRLPACCINWDFIDKPILYGIDKTPSVYGNLEEAVIHTMKSGGNIVEITDSNFDILKMIYGS